MKMTDRWRQLLAQSRQCEHADFSQWLKSGGLREPEDGEERSRVRELYEFCKWVNARNAVITEVSPTGIVAADEPEYRRYEPEGGLCIEHWPYLKVCCGAAGDEELSQICRNEIVDAILQNQLQKKGCSVFVAASAVDDLVREADESDFGPFWTAVEKMPYEELVEALEEQAKAITNKVADALQEQQKSGVVHIEGPDQNGLRVFWWGGEWYGLSPKEFRLVSILWAAPEHSLLLDEVLPELYGVRATPIEDKYVHRVRQLSSTIVAKIHPMAISVNKDPNQMGVHHRVALVMM